MNRFATLTARRPGETPTRAICNVISAPLYQNIPSVPATAEASPVSKIQTKPAHHSAANSATEFAQREVESEVAQGTQSLAN